MKMPGITSLSHSIRGSRMLILLLSLLLFSCHDNAPPRLILVFVDFSETALNEREYYRAEVKKIITKFDQAGDQIKIIPITDKTYTAKPIWEGEPFPGKGILENKLEYKERKEAFQNRLQVEVQAVCDEICKGPISQYTDIINAFMLASDIFSGGKYQRMMILGSDMFEDSVVAGTRWNFERDRIDSKYRSKLMRVLEENKLIPDLSGVMVYVFGAKSAEKDRNDERYIQVRKFWESYIHKTGAGLKGYGQYLYQLYKRGGNAI